MFEIASFLRINGLNDINAGLLLYNIFVLNDII